MKELIKSIALDVGFDIVSFVEPRSISKDSDLITSYQTWISKSLNGDMKYLEEHRLKKFDATLIENWVRTVILVGASYFNSSHFERPSEEFGRVSMYAWGYDYHFVIREMLNEFVERLKREIKKEFKYRVFSDATPLYERGFAVAGGFGFQGKNTCVINSKLGSFFFIGEVLTDLEIEYDDRIKFKGCGSCTKCITACPTGALMSSGYVLDARKCISYLTIEYRRVIPDDLAVLIGDWIFGCDICQEVCPFNKILYLKKFVTRIKKFNTDITPFLNLKYIMSIPSSNQFKKAFKGKAFLRAGRRGMVRNAIIVAVNNGAKSLRDTINKLVEDKDEVVAKTAKWASDRI